MYIIFGSAVLIYLCGLCVCVCLQLIDMDMFCVVSESASVHHHSAGHRHGGQPELWPVQHRHGPN